MDSPLCHMQFDVRADIFLDLESARSVIIRMEIVS